MDNAELNRSERILDGIWIFHGIHRSLLVSSSLTLVLASPLPTATSLVVHPVDTAFITQCRLATFDPARQITTNFDILFRFGGLFGEGITKTEFKKIFRRCTNCHHLVYGDRRAYHRCEGPVVDIQAEDFDLVQTLLGAEENRGITKANFARLTVTCDDCRRLCLISSVDFHECIRSPHRPVARFRF